MLDGFDAQRGGILALLRDSIEHDTGMVQGSAGLVKGSLYSGGAYVWLANIRISAVLPNSPFAPPTGDAGTGFCGEGGVITILGRLPPARFARQVRNVKIYKVS